MVVNASIICNSRKLEVSLSRVQETKLGIQWNIMQQLVRTQYSNMYSRAQYSRHFVKEKEANCRTVCTGSHFLHFSPCCSLNVGGLQKSASKLPPLAAVLSSALQ
jgi:hypothetical protein